MKNKIYVLLVIASLSLPIASQTMPKLVVGNKITYGVEANGKSYDFIVTLTDLNKGIKFNWVMTDPMNLKGSIAISKKALKTAKSYVNYFKPGDQVLDAASSVFISDANFKDLKKYEATIMDMQDGNTGEWHTTYPDGFTFSYKGEDISPPSYYLVLYNESETTKDYKEVVVVTEGNYHLILSMSLGWSIRIKSIE